MINVLAMFLVGRGVTIRPGNTECTALANHPCGSPDEKAHHLKKANAQCLKATDNKQATDGQVQPGQGFVCGEQWLNLQ